MTRTTLVALLALAPGLALAQGAPAQRPPPGAPAIAAPQGEAPAARPAPATPDGAAPATDAVPPPDTYTIKPGDTLWDLSGRFLNNPWYWPKIWSYNPEISNPHWIYPGNVLKFYPAAEEAPTRVEPMTAETPVAAASPEGAAEEDEGEAPVKELEDFSRADLKAPAPVEQSDAVAVAGPYKVGYVPPRARFARHETFVTPRELAESGTIHAAFEEKLLLATNDRAYAQFQKPADVKVGETYVIYRTERAIPHPSSKKGEVFGYQSVILGSAKVVETSDRAATLQIVQSFDTIERGDLLGPWTQKFFRPVDRKPNKQQLDGQIIGSQVDVVTQFGENHTVFIDRGERDGVQEGNVFMVLRSGDQYGGDPYQATWDSALPVEVVGELLVVDVKEHASTALVAKSRKELVIGDRVEMRPEAGSGGN
jgi:nucleoid-associated protein YgaU